MFTGPVESGRAQWPVSKQGTQSGYTTSKRKQLLTKVTKEVQLSSRGACEGAGEKGEPRPPAAHMASIWSDIGHMFEHVTKGPPPPPPPADPGDQ